MPPLSQPGQNQTLLELIYALKGLAQTVEFYHQDITRQLGEEVKNRAREIEQLRELIANNDRAISVLPITVSDRVEKLISNLESDLGDKVDDGLREVNRSIVDVREKLAGFVRASDSSDGVPRNDDDEENHVTGRVEITDTGGIKLALKASALKKIWYFITVVAALGGGYGIWKAISALFQ